MKNIIKSGNELVFFLPLVDQFLNEGLFVGMDEDMAVVYLFDDEIEVIVFELQILGRDWVARQKHSFS